MGEPTYQLIEVADLHLDLENDRIGQAPDEGTAEEMLWRGYGPHICGLADHVVRNGLNMGDPMYIIERESGGFVVLEGNRRLVALRCLADTSRVPGDLVQAITQFSRMAGQIKAAPERAWCIVYATREEADVWIDLKHEGPGAGEGTVKWEPEAKYNRNVRRGKPREYGPETWKWLQRTYARDPEISALTERAMNVQFSYMARLANNAVFREVFGFSMGERGLESSKDKNSLVPAVKKLLHDMGLPKGETSRADARHIGSGDQIETYAQQTLGPLVGTQETLDVALPESSTIRTPQPSASTRPAPVPEVARPGADSPGPRINEEHDVEAILATLPTPVNPPPDSDPRTRLFPGVPFECFSKSTNELGRQAQRIAIGPNVEVCGVLCRVVVDLACTEFLDRMNSPSVHEVLWKRVVSAIRLLNPSVQDSRAPDPLGLRDAFRESNRGTAGLAVEEMHRFVHGSLASHSPREIHRFNDLYTPLLLAIGQSLTQPAGPVATGTEGGQS